jgi:uncharacterized protein
MDPLIVLFGLGVGVLIGLTGIGGGSLMTPLLILVVGVKPVVAIGTDLAYGAITKTVGGWRHLRQGTVDLKLCGWMAVGSVPGSLAGVAIIDRLHQAYGKQLDDALLAALAVALVLVAVAILVRALFMPALVARESDQLTLDARGKAIAVGIGLVLGFILGLTSVGSGALIGLALILVFRLTPKRVVGTDVVHAALLLYVAGFGHFLSGNVDFGLMANILVGSVPGVWLGSTLITKVPQDGLRPALGVVLLGSALAVFTKAGVPVPVAVIVGVPVAVALFAWALHHWRVRPPAVGPAPAAPIPEQAG